jgi:hypothetical protein
MSGHVRGGTDHVDWQRIWRSQLQCRPSIVRSHRVAEAWVRARPRHHGTPSHRWVRSPKSADLATEPDLAPLEGGRLSAVCFRNGRNTRIVLRLNGDPLSRHDPAAGPRPWQTRTRAVCSFCGCTNPDRPMVAGLGVWICAPCVHLSLEIVDTGDRALRSS